MSLKTHQTNGIILTNMTVNEAVLEAIKTINDWATIHEIYDFMVCNGLNIGHNKKPKDTISATCVRLVRDGILKERKLEGMKCKQYCIDDSEIPEYDSTTDTESTDETSHTSYIERDLHPLMANYLWSKGIYPKTIYQERSTRADQAQKWVHPDIVGVEFVELSKTSANSLMKAVNTENTMSICSYELKREINTDYALKQYFFQALSNSSWANYGYLVALDINSELMDEMERLNQAFGIGIIQLAPQPEKTKVLFVAKQKALDYRTLDKLCNINRDFEEFITSITNIITATERYLHTTKEAFGRFCDEKFASEEQTLAYCNEHHIPC